MPRLPASNAVFRRLQPQDYPALLALQEANLRENLTSEERSQGFLSARFSADQFAQMDAAVAVAVGSVNGQIASYLCGSTVEMNRRFPLLSAMIDCYARLQWQGRALDRYTSFVYGPVCIDRYFRGAGLLRGMYRTLLEATAVRFEIGVALVAKENSHSLAAHVDGLGMSAVGQFQFNDNSYYVLAFDTKAIQA